MASERSAPSTTPVSHTVATRIRHAAKRATAASPAVKRVLKEAAYGAAAIEQEMARFVPAVIQPGPRRITIAITAYCNLRCIGCRYGRDFMPLQQLTLAEVKELLDDAKAAGVETVRLYGGEPLLHPDLPEMVRHAVGIGLSTYVTTNGVLLAEKIDALFEAGLRDITIGYYGTEGSYDAYTQRPGRFARLEAGLEYARSRYGSALSLQLNFLIMRPSGSIQALRTAWDFAERFDMTFHTDLIHYSLPYFTDGTNGDLRFHPADEATIRELAAELARLKRAHPGRIPESFASINSIPDWLLKGPGMEVPCDARKMIWVGADGTVQLCYVTFKLGNIRERPLREILFTPTHRKAARDAFLLNCPHCHCERDERIRKHLPSRIRYARLPPASG